MIIRTKTYMISKPITFTETLKITSLAGDDGIIVENEAGDTAVIRPMKADQE